MEIKYPFKQKKSNGLLIREFNKDVDSDELVWHRDRDDRYVTVNRGRGWKLQLENQLPVSLSPGKTYFIPAKTYHRVLKGQSNLVVTIKEGKMKKGGVGLYTTFTHYDVRGFNRRWYGKGAKDSDKK